VTSRIATLAIDATDPRPVADFWCSVLGWTVLDEDPTIVSIGPPEATPDAGGPTIDVVRVPESKTVKNRLHFDLRADGTTRDDELARLLSLGARRVDVGQGPDVTWVVLADPEGNEFCLLQRTVQEAAGE
jgi:predicted enzyme related to lactoylglutathione lyase